MRTLVGFAIILATAVLPCATAASAQEPPWPPQGCATADPAWSPVVDEVACVLVPSAVLGGATPVNYHVPAACADTTCPVIYNLHGFGGDHRSQLGTAGAPSSWIAALTSAPAVDPATVDDPWTLADPATWVAAEPLPLIQVTTHGRTLPGGFGPRAGLEGFYSDWNPRYAGAGADPRYDTPPPRFETFVMQELEAFVTAHLPTRPGRAHRAITGVSLGGFGSYKLGLAHPDRFAAIGSVSGAHNFLFAPAPDAGDPPETSAPFVVDAGGILLPSIVGGATLPLGPAEGFTVPFTAYGDTAADQPYYRGNMPVDLARNGRAYRDDGSQITVLNAFANDAIPRRAEDVADPAGYAGAQALEAIVVAMNQDQELAFTQHGVERAFATHPGLHSGVYWNPWLRGHLEALAAHLAPPGTDPDAVAPTVFDHRSIASGYTIWDWGVTAERDTVEFLDLTDVNCSSITLRGTGVVTIDVPDRCGTGRATAEGPLGDPFVVDLGPGSPLVLPSGINPGATTVTVDLVPVDETGPSPQGGAGQPAPGSRSPATPGTGGGAGFAAVVALLGATARTRHVRRRSP